MSQNQRTKNDWLIAAGFVAMALLLRLLFLFSSPDRDWPHSIWYEGDAPLWVDYAAALDKAVPFEFNVPLHGPGVAYPLKWFYPDVHEKGFVGIKTLWCVCSAIACGLLYLCCVPTGRRVGLVAATLCTFSFGQYVTATSLNTEAPYTMLLCALVLLTQMVLAGRSAWWTTALGVTHGLANLVRPEHTLLVLMWAGWLAMHKRFGPQGNPATPEASRTFRQLLVAPSLMLAVFVLTCLPWSIQASRNVRGFNHAESMPEWNYTATPPWISSARARLAQLPPFSHRDNFAFITHVAGQEKLTAVDAPDIDRILKEQFDTIPRPLSPIVFICNQGALSFALANHPKSDGGFSRAPLEHKLVGTNPTFRLTFPPHLRLLNDGYRVGCGYIADDPARWAQLVGKKLSRFSDGAALGFTAGDLPAGRSGAREPVDQFTPTGTAANVWRWVFLAAMGAGIVVACQRRVAGIWLLIIGYKLVVTILFYGYARQAVSIAPAFFVLAALLIDEAVARLGTRSGRWVLGLGAALVIAGVAIDVTSAIRRRPLMAEGPFMEAAPRWAEGAFQSFGRVEIKPDSAAP